MDFAHGMLEYLEVSFRVEGAENLPDPAGRYIFVANHPLGGPDGIILISFLGQKYSNLKFPVNRLIAHLKNLNNIFLPVNKHGALAKDAVTGNRKRLRLRLPDDHVPRRHGQPENKRSDTRPRMAEKFRNQSHTIPTGHCTHLHRRKKFEFLLQSGKFPAKKYT